MNENQRLPQAFLRSLESDLRALCADARRRNPDLKEAAERVILSLKEADSIESELEAADNAASAFSAACEAADPSASSTTTSLQNKISLRAVSCLHKLLTHRALSTSRLKEVLNAFQRLGSNCIDDNVTLKVLQGLLSLLTVRTYAKSLTEDELSRAFSLLFILKTSNSGNAALSAISPMPMHHESGVIEQTAKAAFRQISSDLFASAANSAVCTAVEKQIPSGSFIALAEFPSEVQAAHSLFMDLCNATKGEPASWLAKINQGRASAPVQLPLSLSLEVIDDCLLHNIGLFAAQPVFSEVMSARLCPTLHQLLKTTSEKTTIRSLLGLVVTIITNYWRGLKPDVEIFLSTLAKMSTSSKVGQNGVIAWTSIFGMEALRCIFALEPADSPLVMHLSKDFDLQGSNNSCITNVVTAAIEGMSSINSYKDVPLPPHPITGKMKPFTNNIKNTLDFNAAIATGLYLNIIQGAESCILRNEEEVAKFLLSVPKTGEAIALLGSFASFNRMTVTVGQKSSEELRNDAVQCVAQSIGRISTVANDCKMDSIRDQTITAVASACKKTIAMPITPYSVKPNFSKETPLLYTVLFDVVDKCRETLKRSWLPVLDAFDRLNELIMIAKSVAESEGSDLSAEAIGLENQLAATFQSSSELSWNARRDLLLGLIQCSRQAITNGSKNTGPDETLKKERSLESRVFGMGIAEIVLLLAFKVLKNDANETLSELWQLVAGHYVSVCTDSSNPNLRKLALDSLTHIACGAIASRDVSTIKHDMVINPFVDLLSSSYPDARSGSLSSLYQILESHGELLQGEPAWLAVLSILSKSVELVTGPSEVPVIEGKDDENPKKSSSSIQSQTAGLEIITSGFKVVQVIADDFLSSLGEKSVSSWIHVLGQYSCQTEDVNVAFTSIDFLWRTADLIGKTPSLSNHHDLWITVFTILKNVSMDLRPEIRNCAVKTLTGALSAHSSHLSASAWIGCAANALLPLLENVMQAGVGHPSKNDKPPVTKGNGDVQLRVHHSRDTPRKQWNETRVLALAGVARVLRIAMPRLASLHDENGNPLFLMLTTGGATSPWRKILRAAGVASASRDGEVAIAGVSALLELLNAAGFVVSDGQTENEMTQTSTRVDTSTVNESIAMVDPNDSGSNIWPTHIVEENKNNLSEMREKQSSHENAIILWEAVWSALAEALGEESARTSTDSRNGEGKIVNDRALKTLAEGLIQARENLPQKFTSSSSKILVNVFKHLAIGTRTSEYERTTRANNNELTDVQEVTLNGMKHLSFGEDDEGWSGLIDSLLGMIDYNEIGRKRSRKLITRVFDIISYLYTESNMSIRMKRRKLPELLNILGRTMAEEIDTSTNNNEESDLDIIPLWEEAVKVILTIMENRNENSNALHDERVWKEFIGHVETFMYKNQKGSTGLKYMGNGKSSQNREKYCIELTNCVKNGLIVISRSKDEETRNKLLKILARGAEEGSYGWRPRFVRNCQSCLLDLIDGNNNGSKCLIERSEEYVIQMCNRILGKFVSDGQRAGKCPLPATRRAEAMFLMIQLRRMYENGSSLVITLYPRLCECVESKDEAIRSLAKELLDETAPKASKQTIDDRDLRNTLVV